MQALDTDSVHRVLAAAKGTVWYPIFHLDLYTGMRRGEILGLRWKDVDLNLLVLYITQAIHQLDDGCVNFQEPKTPRSWRSLALSPTAVIALKAHRDRQEADFLILDRPLTPENPGIRAG